MAQIYSELVEFERAIKMHQEVLAIEKKVLPLVHSAIVRTYSSITLIYYSQNNFNDALDNYNMALEIFEQIYGSEHPDLGTIFRNIGYVHSKKLDDTTAESHYEMAFDIHQKYLLSSGVDLALTHNSMGSLHRDRLQSNIIGWYYEKALKILLLPEHKNENRKRAYTYNNYGQYYEMIKDSKQAIDYYKKSLAELERIYEDNTYQPNIVMAHIKLGHTYNNARDFDNAMKHNVKPFQLLTKLDGKSSD